MEWLSRVSHQGRGLIGAELCSVGAGAFKGVVMEGVVMKDRTRPDLVRFLLGSG